MRTHGIKAVISDFDDTIRDTESGLIPESFWRVVSSLRDEGIELIIVTGRVRHSVENLMKDSERRLDLTPGLFANGSVMYGRSGQAKVLGQFSETQASEIFEYLKLLKQAGVKVDFGISGVNRSYGYAQGGGEGSLTTLLNEQVFAIDTVQDIVLKYEDVPVSFCWLCENTEVNALVQKLMIKAFPELNSPDCLFEFSRGYMIDPRVGKAAGIRALLAELKISDHEIIVIGDGSNDIGMLDAFEHSIVMGNAAEWLKAKHGKVIAPSLRDDGWARSIENYLARLDSFSTSRGDQSLVNSTTDARMLVAETAGEEVAAAAAALN